jgi:hypothetical protein
VQAQHARKKNDERERVENHTSSPARVVALMPPGAPFRRFRAS